MKEIWKTIENYDDYQVSNLGNVKSLKFGKEKILKAGLIGNGYLQVSLCKNGIKNNWLVHRLVANAFIQNPYNLPVINHIDENKKK